MSRQRFGPEWNAVLLTLAIIAVGIVLSLLHWWLGLSFVLACIAAFAIALWS